MSRKSVYLRSVLYMITIVSAVVLLGCGIYYASIRSHLLGELQTSNARIDKQIATTYELFLDTAIKAAMVSVEAKDSPSGTGFLLPGTDVPSPAGSAADPRDTERQIYERLNRLTQISDFIHSAYYFTRNHVYVSMGFSFEAADFYDKDWLESLDTSRDLAVLPARKLPLLPNGSKEVIPIVMNFPLHAAQHTYTYVLHIDANQLFRSLIREQNVYDGFRFRIIDPSGMIFVSSDSDVELFSQVQDYAYLEPNRVLRSEEDNFITSRKGNKILVSSYTSPRFGWKYVSESDYDPLSRSMLVPLQLISIVVALSLIVSIVAVMGVSRRLFRPVKEIVRLLGLSDTGDRDEYELISGRIHTFLNENQRMQAVIERNRTALKRQFLSDLLLRSAYKDHEVLEKLAYFELNVQPNYTVIVLRVDDVEQYTARFSVGDRMLWEFAMENIVTEIVRPHGECFFLSLETAKLAVAVSIDGTAIPAAEAESRTAELAYSMRDAIRQYLKISVSAGVGRAKSAPGGLNQSYQEGLSALTYAESVGPYEVVTYRELHGATAQPEYPVQLEEKLLQQLLKGDREGAGARLAEMFEAARDRRSAQPGDQIWLPFQLLHTLARKMMELQIPETEPLFDGMTFHSLCQSVLQAKSDPQRLALLTRWTDWFCGYIVERREHTSNEHVRQMLAFIQEHYREPISVDLIADRIGLNRVYVGRLFKQVVNQNMADYINQVRIEKAVELMSSTPLKVMEIAEAVGFNNTHYFIKMFKKLMNVTPGKYMERLTAEAEANEGRQKESSG